MTWRSSTTQSDREEENEMNVLISEWQRCIHVDQRTEDISGRTSIYQHEGKVIRGSYEQGGSRSNTLLGLSVMKKSDLEMMLE